MDEMGGSLTKCIEAILADGEWHETRSLIYETWALIRPETAARERTVIDPQLSVRMRIINRVIHNLATRRKGVNPPRLVTEQEGIGMDRRYRLKATICRGSEKDQTAI